MPDCPTCDPSPWWHLFDAEPFNARGSCGDFGGYRVAWVLSSAGLFVLYTAIAVFVLTTSQRLRREASGGYPAWASWSVAAFFFGCAGTHLSNAAAFWWPAYRLFVAWDWYTLVASLIGGIALAKILLWGGWQFGVARAAARLAEERHAELRKARHDLNNERTKTTLLESRIQLLELRTGGQTA